jgi:hypothetical protein
MVHSIFGFLDLSSCAAFVISKNLIIKLRLYESKDGGSSSTIKTRYDVVILFLLLVEVLHNVTKSGILSHFCEYLTA